MFNSGYESGYKPEEDKEKPVRFSPKVIASMKGRALPPPERSYRYDAGTAYVPLADRDYFSKPYVPKQSKPKAQKQKKQKMEPEILPPVSEAGIPPEGVLPTTDYAMFGLLATNRPVDKAHVRALAAAIRRKNMLHLNPILVNANKEVIDGQHRLEAAKSLGVKIFYVQAEEITQDDIASMNSNKKNWAMPDYIHFYAAKGMPDYVTFQNFCKEQSHMPIGTLISLCSADGKRNTKKVHDGHLDISRISFAKDMIGFLKDFQRINESIATSSRFIEALALIAAHAEYDHQRLIGKVEMNPGALVPCANNKQYVQLLQSIYNKGVREQNIVMFLKRF